MNILKYIKVSKSPIVNSLFDSIFALTFYGDLSKFNETYNFLAIFTHIEAITENFLFNSII